ncbi:hypothetical protein, variant [Phytophthora nicotianae]|uniref:Uncharacterized protein n=1 Tax=Phytophthora nicotianae TaxID=4792 RepID=W2K696_PHYNI|nr:hypothetical protein, variant [Phytophthora nicotianae]
MRLPSASLRPCRQPPQPVRTSTASKLLVQSNNQLLMGLEHVRGLLLDWEADHVSRTPSSARRSVVAHRGSPDPAQQAELDTRTIVTHLPVCQLHQLQRPAQPSTSFVTRRPSGSTSQTPSTALARPPTLYSHGGIHANCMHGITVMIIETADEVLALLEK